MAALISPQPLAVGETIKNKLEQPTTSNPKHSYAAQLQQKQPATSKVDWVPVTVVHGQPTVEFTMDQVNEFIREEGLHQAVVMKFSYGKPELQEIRKTLSSQFDIEGRCNIGQLEYRHLLLRFDLFTDFVKFISKSTGYMKSKGEEFFFRTFPWTLDFNPKEETSMAVVWISFPGLPPNFFAKRSLLSIASAVGKPIAVDKATQERTRPSAARVKVILDLMDKHPKKVKIVMTDRVTGKSIEHDQEVVYDNLPRYCTFCKHQGHQDKSCRVRQRQVEEEAVEEVTSGENNLPTDEVVILGKNQLDLEAATGVESVIADRAGETVQKVVAALPVAATMVEKERIAIDRDDTAGSVGSHGVAQITDDFSKSRIQNANIYQLEEKEVGHLDLFNEQQAVKKQQHAHGIMKDKDVGQLCFMSSNKLIDILKAGGPLCNASAGDFSRITKQQNSNVKVHQRAHGTVGSLEEIKDKGAGHVDHDDDSENGNPMSINNNIIDGVQQVSHIVVDPTKETNFFENEQLAWEREWAKEDLTNVLPGHHVATVGINFNAAAGEKEYGDRAHGKEEDAADQKNNVQQHVAIKKSDALRKEAGNSFSNDVHVGSTEKRGHRHGLASLSATPLVSVDPVIMDSSCNALASVEGERNDMQTAAPVNFRAPVDSAGISVDREEATTIADREQTTATSCHVTPTVDRPTAIGTDRAIALHEERPNETSPVCGSKQMVLVDDSEDMEAITSPALSTSNLGEVMKGMFNPSKLQFSNPQVKQIIKDAQVSMMLNASPMIKQPLVTLNTSAQEIPSQSVESVGEHSGGSGHALLSTGNDKELIREKNNEITSRQEEKAVDRTLPRIKTWADRIENWENGADDELISEHDRVLLDTLGSPKPQRCAYSTGSKTTARKMKASVAKRHEPRSEKKLKRQDPLWMVLQDEINQKLDTNLRIASSHETKEDELIESYQEEATTIEDLAPKNDEEKKVTQVTLRQLPMRAAKQKGIVTSTSTRSIRSDKK